MKKTFKNIRTLAALLMAGAAFTACSSDDSIVEEQPVVNPSEPVYTLTINATNGDATTRALDLDGDGKLSATWAEGDVVTVTKGATSLGTLSVKAGTVSADGLSATFEGTLSGAVAKDDELTLTYHPINPANPVGAFEAQDGTLKGTAGAEKFDVATATVTVASVNEGKITATDDANFTTKVAMIKLTLQDNAATPNKLNATSLKVSASLMGGAINKDVLTFTIPASTYTDTDGGAGILYFALPSAATVAAKLASDYHLDEATAATALTAATITFTATVGCDTYTVNKTGYKFVAGKYYKATLTMTKQAPSYTMAAEATTADYGKVVCAAGHLHDAQTALPVGSTAVGILGRVTSTGHGLILALQNATNQTWNTINGWASETTYAGTTLKVLPDDAARGSLTSYTKLGETTVSNWAVAQKNDYDAIFTNLGSTTGDSDGKVYDANVNAYITTGVGGTAISGSYWSATTNTDANAWRFGSSTWLSRSKSNSASVRPVLAF